MIDIENARALVETLKDYAEHPSSFTDISPTEADAAADLIAALLDERDALARDAARYRHLAETTTFTDVIERAYSTGLTYHVRRWFHDSNDQFDTLDETIDAEMKGASDE